ncbi:MAG: DNA polymerase Y family protein [Alphaproteobacteria bacterium]|nr:DNA polymerase Y family protein [Alphaproteobacteria bacterium]
MTIHRPQDLPGPQELPGIIDRFPVSPHKARPLQRRKGRAVGRGMAGQTLGVGGEAAQFEILARRYLAIALPRFALERLAPYHPDVASTPYALTTDQNGRRIVHAVNAAAEALGVRAGQPLTDARAVAPMLKLRAYDPAGEGKALDKLAQWAERYTPKVAVLAPDTLLLDLTGCAHLMGGERPLLRDLAARLDGFGLSHRLAAADTPGAALAVSRYAVEPVTLVESGRQREAVGDLPVAGLRLPPATVDGLARVGLTRIGQLYPVARAPLAARFGAAVGTRLDQVLGKIDDPLTPRRRPPRHRVRLAFAEPILTLESIQEGVRRLLGRLCERLAADGRGVRRLVLTAHRVDGAVLPLAIGTSTAARESDRLYRLFHEHLDKLDPGFGIEVMTLEAPATDGMLPDQATLDAADADRAETETGPLADRLVNRLGSERVTRPEARDRHIPEQAEAMVPLDRSSTGSVVPWAVGKGKVRPLRLFKSPEPVEVVAMVPDSPPVMLFWRGTTHRITAAEGPERIASEWWIEKAPPRDYYRVQDAEGRRLWIYRDRPYGGESEPRWYIHGVFA